MEPSSNDTHTADWVHRVLYVAPTNSLGVMSCIEESRRPGSFECHSVKKWLWWYLFTSPLQHHQTRRNWEHRLELINLSLGNLVGQKKIACMTCMCANVYPPVQFYTPSWTVVHYTMYRYMYVAVICTGINVNIVDLANYNHCKLYVKLICVKIPWSRNFQKKESKQLFNLIIYFNSLYFIS